MRDKIIDALGVGPKRWVVEIGPGPGALTGPLTERCARVVAVELDRDLAAALPEVVPRPKRLEVRLMDGAGLDYAEIARAAGQPLLVVGNLPFNAAAPILRRALEQGSLLERLVLMFQREVAIRLCAAPGTKDYGLLSVVTQQRARVKRLFDVAPGSFRPVPRVAASVVRLEPTQVLGDCCLKVHDTLVSAAFAQRRKTLKNSLRARAPWDWDLIRNQLEEADIPDGYRAEAVGVAQWAEVSKALCRALGSCAS